ncbi:MAG: translation initiation factor IF-2 N-terminal domain-containing protein, partial [Actinobacteria bacterium]|nr:translation initiation factor IF-2 N-terminal domain-containing protein [Actinomycetota bacterium]
MSNLAAKIRVYELARELGLTNKETLDLCDVLGIGVKSHSSGIVEAQADRVRRKADALGMRRDVQPEEPESAKAATKKAPAKKAAAKRVDGSSDASPGEEPTIPAAGEPPAPEHRGAPATPGDAASVPTQPTPGRVVSSRPAARSATPATATPATATPATATPATATPATATAGR